MLSIVKNKKSQSIFIYKFFNKKQNSDINAAKNILIRSSQETETVFTSN